MLVAFTVLRCDRNERMLVMQIDTRMKNRANNFQLLALILTAVDGWAGRRVLEALVVDGL